MDLDSPCITDIQNGKWEVIGGGPVTARLRAGELRTERGHCEIKILSLVMREKEGDQKAKNCTQG